VVVEDAGGGVTVGVVKVWVAVAVVVAAVLDVLVADVLVDDVVVWVALALAFSGGTGTAAPGRVTVACAAGPASRDASDPVRAGAEFDFTALPIPKPAAIAMTSSAPSSHLRRSMSHRPFARFQG
jgi:hypothetical protein